MTQDPNPLSPETIKAAVSEIMAAAGADPDLAQYTIEPGLFGEFFAVPLDIYTLIAFHGEKPPQCIFPGDVWVNGKAYFFKNCDDYGIRGKNRKLRICVYHHPDFLKHEY